MAGKGKSNCVYWDSNIIKSFSGNELAELPKRNKKELKSTDWRVPNGYQSLCLGH